MRHTLERGMLVRSAGAEEGRAVLWVHGLGESGLCFEGIVGHPRLAAFRHLVPDLPGHGRSPWLDEPASLAEQADLLARWLAGRGEGAVVVVGHSMGGVVATLLAERHPEAVSAVVDVDGNLSLDDCTYSSAAAAQPEADFLGSGMDRLRDRIYREGLEDAALRGYYVALRLADPRAYHVNSLELVEVSRGEDLALRLAALEARTVYVAGAPGGASARSRRLLVEAGVRCVELSPSGHWPFIDQPDGFAEALGGFLTRP